MAKKTLVSATINGELVEFLCEPHQSLLSCLRDDLDLTGAGLEVLEDEAVIGFDLLGEVFEFEFLAAEVGGGLAGFGAEAEAFENGHVQAEGNAPLFLHVIGP